MRIDFRSKNIELSPSLHRQVEKRTRFAVGRFADRVTRLVVSINDINGPRGGIDKRCRVRVSGPSLEVLATDDAAEVEVAIDRALARVARNMRRQANLKKEGPQRRRKDVPLRTSPLPWLDHNLR